MFAVYKRGLVASNSISLFAILWYFFKLDLHAFASFSPSFFCVRLWRQISPKEIKDISFIFVLILIIMQPFSLLVKLYVKSTNSLDGSVLSVIN